LIFDIVSQSFRNPPGNEHSFLLAATFWISYGHLDTINVIWGQFEYLTYSHPCSGLQFQNESISYLQTAIDDLVYGFSVNHRPNTYSSRTKDPFDDKGIARVGKTEFIAIEDVVEKSSKVSAPAVPGALFFGTGQKCKKGKGLF